MAGKKTRSDRKKAKKRQTLGKDKVVKTIQMQREDGSPLNEEDPQGSTWNMNKRQKKDYDRVIGSLMRERGLSEEEAVNEMLRSSLNRTDQRELLEGISTVRTSRLHELDLAKRSVLTGIGLSNIKDDDHEYADPERAHLLEPGAEALLETEISKRMASTGEKYAEARSNVLTAGDRLLDERDYEKLIRHYERTGELEPAQLEMLQNLYHKAKRKNDALAASEPWFKRLNKIKGLNPSARSLLRWIGMLQEMPKWSEADEDATTPEESLEKIHRWTLDFTSKCRIFDVSPVEVGMLVANILEHMRRMLDIEEIRDFTEQEIDALLLQTEAMGFPANLPYPETFVGFGEGFWVDDTFFTKEKDSPQLRLLGLLYTNTAGGYIELLYSWEKSASEHRFPDLPHMATQALHTTKKGWAVEDAPPELQWMAVALIDTINAHRTVVLEAPPMARQEERHLQRLTRSLNLQIMPAAFYTAELRSKVYFHAVRRLHPIVAHKRAMSYRTDRRAHEKCRIQRGPLPRTAKERLEHEHNKKALIKRGYTIYEHEDPSGIDEERLLVRGLKPKHPGEWLAILAYSVRQTIVGPSEAPYVPRVDKIKTLNPTDVQA